MSKVAVHYGSLDKASSEAKAVSRKLDSYANALERTVSNKLSDYSGEWSSNMSTAYSQTSKKINQLRDLADDYSEYSSSLTNLKAECERTDTAVRSSVQLLTSEFKAANGIKDSKVRNAVGYAITSWGNRSNDSRKRGDEFDDFVSDADSLFDSIEQWYDYEGGKELIVNGLVSILEIAVGVVSIVAAVVSIVATGGVSLTIIAGLVGGMIATVNGAVNWGNEIEAYIYTNKGNDPAMGYRRSKINTVQDALRTDTDSRLAHSIATVIDIVDFACSVIDFADSIGNIKKFALDFKDNFKNGFKWLTGDTRPLADITMKDILSKDTFKAGWSKLGGLKDMAIDDLSKAWASIKRGEKVEILFDIKSVGTDFLNNLKGHYLDFSSDKKGLDSLKNLLGTSKDFLDDGIDWKDALGAFLPGVDKQSIPVFSFEKGGQMSFDIFEFDINEMFKTGMDLWGIGEKGWELGKNVYHDIDISLDKKRILEKLSTVSNVDIKISDIYVPKPQISINIPKFNIDIPDLKFA